MYLLYTLNIDWIKYALLLVNMGIFAYFVSIRSVAFGIRKTMEMFAISETKKQKDEDKIRLN